MATAILERTMGKARGRPRRSDREDVTVKLERSIAAKVKLIAAHRGVPMAELLSDLLRNPTNQAYAKMLRELEGKG
jgi:hypothetical protein